jgi:hypothetical protein
LSKGAAVIVWLGISLILAVIVIAAPWRWAIAAFLFFVPFSATAVAMVGQDPILLPLVLCAALIVRYGFSLADKVFREEALSLIGREGFLFAFLAYCVVSGLLFPRLFEGETQVFRLESNAFVLMPVGPQNISVPQILYLVIGGFAFLALRHGVYRVGPASAVLALVAQAGFIGFIGLLQSMLGFAGVALPVDWVVNNEGGTMMLGQDISGFYRVTGVFLEASTYGGWGVAALAVVIFLFLNNILPLVSAVVASILALTLVLSTSATALGGLAVLALGIGIAALLDEDRRRKERSMALVAIGAVAGAIVLYFVLTAQYGPLYGLRLLLEDVIFGKQYSSSFQERGAWASSGFQAGVDTYLLGVGYGALRVSGVGALLIGGIGIPGTLLFIAFLWPKIAIAFKRASAPEAAAAAAIAIALIPALGSMLISGTDLALYNMFWFYAAVAAGAMDRVAAASLVAQRIDAQRQESPSAASPAA